ncbi:probable peroxisomal membrane protein PEX13 [Harmonia axyridis]|uniref:probable peroxisomal membrane protein PEX13 n=1 Tax=Harmonia axyridis TaxID=115357 RepID=UPI001E2791B5|nr:probable peroxisomal membrane protein PEX13 [Harmonia axyridis]
MYKFVFVLALVSCVAAAPGYLLGGYGVPAATSYSSRVDYPSPVVAKTVVAAPVVPAYGLGYGSHYGGHYGGLVYPYGSGSYYGNNLGYGHGLGHGYGYGSLY